MLKKLRHQFLKLRKALADNAGYIKMLRSEGVKVGADCVIHKSATFGTEPYLISIGDHVRITQDVRFITA